MLRKYTSNMAESVGCQYEHHLYNFTGVTLLNQEKLLENQMRIPKLHCDQWEQKACSATAKHETGKGVEDVKGSTTGGNAELWSAESWGFWRGFGRRIRQNTSSMSHTYTHAKSYERYTVRCF